MPTKEELLDAINELQSKAPTYGTCEKLATFYTLLSHLYSDDEQKGYSYSIGYVFSSEQQGSEFRKTISGKDIDKVLNILDEHMEVVQILFPKEYQAVLDKIKDV